MKKYALIIFSVIYLGCHSSSNRQIVTISLVDSGKNLQIKGIENDILGEIARDTSLAIWQSLIPVYKMPADTDMKDYQRPQPGKYLVMNNAVVFTPDTPFAKQQRYFVRWFRFDKGNMPLDYIRSNKKVGKIPYEDLEFKP